VAGDWGPEQILREPSTEFYTDSNLAWCPDTKDGTGTSTNDFDEVGHEDTWNRDAVFANSGYTEYIEVKFETPVYVSDIEVGEVRGCGSIVRVHAQESGTNNSMVVYSGQPDTECDADDGLARLTNTINRFSPPRLCNPPFLADTVRVEMDTRAVADWNELDYVKVIGYARKPVGVLPFGITKVNYVPDSNYHGSDTFSFFATDCGYHDIGNR